MGKKYQKIRQTPTFISAYSELRSYLKTSSPLAFLALPQGMKTVLNVIDDHPRGWPVRRKNLGGVALEFHLAIVSIAYRRLHIRYHVDVNDVSHLLAVWVDGHDEPRYLMDSFNHDALEKTQT
jgi:hypothetical protein